MPLSPGTRLGPYEVIAPLGAGGMGEVYKARDTRLDRLVAIKILPPEWGSDAAMQERFEHEARIVASLNHPHICTLHDTGTDNGIAFLVMEYMEGETLAERLTRGALSLDEAMTVGIAIADALDKAHRKGVIHRDLKPANVMLVRSSGLSGLPVAKLLDFGLAKSQAPLPAASNLTIPGMILGTMQYMAPEQFDGAEADRRTDIFAFGVLMHEMITGKKTFEGRSQVMLISAIATSVPEPVSRVQPSAPPALDHVIKTCLEKDPANRWQDARDLVAELQWIADGGDDTAFSVSAAATRSSQRWVRRAVLAAAAVIVAVLAVPAYLYSRGVAAPEELRYRIPRNLTAESLETQPGTAPGFATFSATDSAISPDGRWIVFRGRPTPNDAWALYLRPVRGVAPQRLAGTEEALQPFWSADSRFLAFAQGGKLRRLDASGGAPQDICNLPAGFSGGSWNRAGRIILGSSSGLLIVPADGGTPTALTTTANEESGHVWPRFLPDGRQYLYLADSSQIQSRAIFAGALDSKERTRILAVSSSPAYTSGHLLFLRDNGVYAQPFNAASLALSGEPVRLASDVFTGSNGQASFDVSDDGVLIYFGNTAGNTTGGNDTWPWRLLWIDRQATEVAAVGPFGIYRGFDVSPDGKRVAIHRHDEPGGDIYVLEQPPRSPTRITYDARNDNSSPIWSPDGTTIVFASQRNGKWGLYQARSDGSGAEEPLLESDLRKAPMTWSPDKKHLVYWVQDPKTAGDLWVLSMEDKKAEVLLATPNDETHAQISPDGKWIAFTSNLTGRKEVWVRPFPSGLGQWQISPDDSSYGGDWPRWVRNPKAGNYELLYHSNAPSITGVYAQPDGFHGPIFSVALKAVGDALEAATPQEIARVMAIRIAHTGGDYHTYDISPDGQRLLVMQRVLTTEAAGQFVTELPTPGLTVVMHWLDGLTKK